MPTSVHAINVACRRQAPGAVFARAKEKQCVLIENVGGHVIIVSGSSEAACARSHQKRSRPSRII